jgi:endonuclease/exonuclease/phosphatase family metal-dependent hydrolase
MVAWVLWVGLGVLPGYADHWKSVSSCTEAVKQGVLEDKPKGVLRVGSWNVRWFPDGTPGRAPKENKHTTDVNHLACALVAMQWDVVVLQEIKGTPRAQAMLKQVQKTLLSYTGVPWVLEMPLCTDDTRQHMALLYRSDAVRVSDVALDATVDPTAEERGQQGLCPGFLRPALGVYVQSKRKKGVDFHLVGVHLDSGRGKKDYNHRVYAWRALGEVWKKRHQRTADKDYVVAGDWNAMGTDEGGDSTPEKERVSITRAVGQWSEKARLVTSSLLCSHFYKKHASLMDVFAVSESMAECAGCVQKVSGVCAMLGCESKKAEEVYAFAHVSDHCPVYVDFLDRDEDVLRSAMR